MKTLYLNQSGSKWVVVDTEGKHDKILCQESYEDTPKFRAVQFWEQMGNFAIPTVRIKGKPCIMMESNKEQSGNIIWIVNNDENRAAKYKQNPLRITKYEFNG